MSYSTFVELVEELRKDMKLADANYRPDEVDSEHSYDNIYKQCKYVAKKFAMIDTYTATERIWQFLNDDEESIEELAKDIKIEV